MGQTDDILFYFFFFLQRGFISPYVMYKYILLVYTTRRAVDERYTTGGSVN